ncbi:hypothetical protein SH611_19250 [Geminicoccaceae bacterium 1502E]|nr:hypothetical protein [Geminicoccaceae bacterium 1502E]
MSQFAQDIRKTYAGVVKAFGRYWSVYGGLSALLLSPYFHLSVLLNSLMYNAWTSSDWFELPLRILPSLLGFTLGGYAVFLAIGDRRFHAFLAAEAVIGRVSPFLQISATYAHFVIMQTVALLLAALSSSLPDVEASLRVFQNEVLDGLRVVLLGGIYVIRFLTNLVFLYSLTLAISAVMAIFRVSTWYEKFIQIDSEEGNARH